MAWAKKYRIYRLKCQFADCPRDGELFEGYKRKQMYCSSSCATKARGPEWFKAWQAKTTAKRQANGYSRFVKRMRAAGLTEAQIAVVRKEILMNRSNAFTAGKRKGWQEANGETGDELWTRREKPPRRPAAADAERQSADA